MERKSSIIYIRIPDRYKEDLILISKLKGERQATVVREMLKSGIKKYKNELEEERGKDGQ